MLRAGLCFLFLFLYASCDNSVHENRWVYIEKPDESEKIEFRFPKAILYIRRNAFVDSVRKKISFDEKAIYKLKTSNGDTSIVSDNYEGEKKVFFRGDTISLRESAFKQAFFDKGVKHKSFRVDKSLLTDTIKDEAFQLYNYLITEKKTLSFQFNDPTFVIPNYEIFWIDTLTSSEKILEPYYHTNEIVRDVMLSFVKKGQCAVYDKEKQKYVKGIRFIEEMWHPIFVELQFSDSRRFYYYHFPWFR